MAQHAGPLTRKNNVAKLLGNSVVGHSGPPISLFVELIHAFIAGAAPASGYELSSGLLDTDKAVKMLWCSSEAVADKTRHCLRLAETLNLSRDERHGRLHARFRCVGADFMLRRGFHL